MDRLPSELYKYFIILDYELVNRFNQVIVLLAYGAFCNLYAQSDQLGSLLAHLIYDSSKSYSVHSAVLISLEDGEIYTSVEEVPATTDGSNAPNGINGSTYWKNSAETTTSFESTNRDYLNSLPTNIDSSLLSQQVADLVTPTSDQNTSFINSNKDGFSVALLNEFMAKRNYKYLSNHNEESNYTTDWNSYFAEFYYSNIFGENLLFSNAKEELISINDIDYLCKTFFFQQSHQWGDLIPTSGGTSMSASFYRSVTIHSSLGVLKWNITNLSSSTYHPPTGGYEPQLPDYSYSETNSTFIISSLGEHLETSIDTTENSMDEGNNSNWDKLFNQWLQNPEPYGGVETLEEIKKAKDQNSTELSIYKHMTDLTPLGGLENLRSLWLNDISDENLERIESVDYTPLSELTKLDKLSISDLPFSDLSSLAGLTNLTELFFAFTDLSDLSALSNFPKLEHLGLQTNKLSDISTLPSLQSLKSITLSENVDDLNPLSRLSNLEVLTIYDINHSDDNQVSDITPLLELTNLTDLYIQNDDLNTTQKEMLFSGLHSTQIVLDDIFLERNRNVWSDQYEKWINNPTPYGGLESIKEIKKAYESNQTILNLENRKITDISPISFLKNLQDLNLYDNNITDLSPFLQLSELKVLNLGNNNISNLQPLGNLGELEVLQLEDNFVWEVSPLTELKKIKNLNLGNNYILNISPLEELTALEVLNLYDNYIFSDLSPLVELAGVKEIIVEEGRVILNLSEYADPAYFKELDLEDNYSFSDLSSIVKLGNLQELNLNDNYITDLSSISTLGKLTNLDLSDNFINDLKPLTKLQNLEELDLRDNNITNLEPLSILTNLKSLNIEENPTKDSDELSLLKILSETQIRSRVSNNPKTGEEIITTKLTYTGPVSFKIPERYTFISRNYGASELSKAMELWDPSWAEYAPLVHQSVYLESSEYLDHTDITFFDFSKIEDSFVPNLSEIGQEKPHVYLAVIFKAQEIFDRGVDVKTAISTGLTNLEADWENALGNGFNSSISTIAIKTESGAPGSMIGDWIFIKLSKDSSMVALVALGENQQRGINIAKSLTYNDKLSFKDIGKPLTKNIARKASSGDRILQIKTDEQSYFDLNDKIIIDEGTPFEEYNEVIGFGSLLLKNPLEFDHEENAKIRVYSTAINTTQSELTGSKLSEGLKRSRIENTKWYESDWLGLFFESDNGNWTYHVNMGWVYPVSESGNEENVWIWKEDAGWLWTSEHTFPYLYSYTSKFWIYLNSQDAGQTKYYDYFDDKWRDWGDFPTRTIVEIEGRSIKRILQSDKSPGYIADEIMSILMRGL